jgi:serine/threonine protein kinase
MGKTSIGTMTEKDFFDRFAYDPKKDVLGTGLLGTTYKVYDKKENRFVALKVARVRDDKGAFSLADEVNLSRQLDYHAHVARYEFVFRVEEPVPTDYAVMDFYEDGHLDDFLRKNIGSMSASEMRFLLEGILEGMQHLHQEGVILKTLHPADILMHRSRAGVPVPKIAAFGLRPFRMPDETNAVFFPDTPINPELAYVAPELLAGKSARYQSDIWSFGSIAYRILTGEVAFGAPSNLVTAKAISEIKRKIMETELPNGIKTVAPVYQQLLLRCWSPSLEMRAKSANELLEILRNPVAESKPISTIQAATPTELVENELVTNEISSHNTHFAIHFLWVAGLITLCLVGWFSFNAFKPSNPSHEALAFDRARNAGTLPAWNAYVKRFPQGNYAGEARRVSDSLIHLKSYYMQSAKAKMKADEKDGVRLEYENILKIDPDDAAVKQLLELLRTEL